MSLTGMLQFGIRTSVDLENKMTSVERVIEYSQTPSEAPLESKEGFSLNLKSYFFLSIDLRFLFKVKNQILHGPKMEAFNLKICRLDTTKLINQS